VELGDSNDALSTVPGRGGPTFGFNNFLRVIANGGPGDDVLDARHAAGVGLDGGGGVDQLFGSAYDDRLTDGDRDGAAGAGAPGEDLIDGGQGVDHLSYAQRTAPVFVDLIDEELEGELGEGDIVRDVEGISGGAGDDRLAGNDRGNVLDGGHGRDILIGRGGDDSLGWTFGRPPAGSVWLGRAEWPFHVLHQRTPAVGDTVRCGRGRDRIWGRRARDFVELACELVDTTRMLPVRQRNGSYIAPAHLPAYPIRRRSSLTYPVDCGGLGGDDVGIVYFRCSGSVRLREASGRRLLARGTIPRGTELLTARLRVTDLGHRLATRARGVRATLHVRGDNLPTAAWTIRLKIR
jgi:Ca2+-binding RTX toxin-like protein